MVKRLLLSLVAIFVAVFLSILGIVHEYRRQTSPQLRCEPPTITDAGTRRFVCEEVRP